MAHAAATGDGRSGGDARAVVILAGGTGGARLARGMLDVVGPERLIVIANTGDDTEVYNAHVSPDPDLVTFWLADRIDDRGWGLAGDSFTVMDELRRLGVDTWFALGDRDLAWCLERRRRLSEGERLTEAQLALGRAIGAPGRVLPMSDEPVRTWVRHAGEWRPFQEYMIRLKAAPPVSGVEYRGADDAAPSPEVLAAIAGAGTIVIGPSNPIISIGPILAIPGMREALRSSPAPVVAVSPIVGGRSLKGPTPAFMAYAGRELSAVGIAEEYGDVLDGLVADEPVDGLAHLVIDTRLDSPAARAAVAERTLHFASVCRA